MKEETNFIDTLIAEAEVNEEKQTLAYYDLIVTEIIRLEDQVAETFKNADEESKIINAWALNYCSKYQDKINFLKLKLEAFIREQGKRTIELPHGILKMRKMPDKIEIIDMEIFLANANQEVVTIVPETVKPDLTKIKTYIRNSGRQLPGVTLNEGKDEFKLTLKSKETKNDD